MFIKADRDLDLNYQGTYMVLKGHDQAVHRVLGIEGHELLFADVVSGERIRLNIQDDNVCPELPAVGVRNINGEAFLIGRRVARQYRRGTNLNNLEFVPIGHSLQPRTHREDATVSTELFNPTYPDLRFAVWAITCGKSVSQALTMELAIVKRRKEIGIYYRQWRVGTLDTNTLTPHIFRGNQIVDRLVNAYNWS